MNATAIRPYRQLHVAPEQNPTTRVVSPAKFCELLVSRKILIRSDDRGAKMRGLTDPTLGVRFLVKEEELARLAQ
jgi:hypothetical protein